MAKLKKTRCSGCEDGIKYGPHGGRHGQWRLSVVWAIVDGQYVGTCDCGACYTGKDEYSRQCLLK